MNTLPFLYMDMKCLSGQRLSPDYSYLITAISVLIDELSFRKYWSRHTIAKSDWSRLYSSFVPKAGINEALQKLCSAFHEEALNTTTIEVSEYFFNTFMGIDDGWCAAVFQV